MPAPVMSRLENTSAILGEYMLKGWTLTDLHCTDCRVTPLMREPSAQAEREGRDRIQFCASCDGRPEGRPSASASASSSTTSTISPPAIPARSVPSSETTTSTEIDEHSSEKRARSDQADDAASSISSLLLKGYSLLGDNCPNSQCRGIPLVGYPRKPDGSKDGRKMCVSCNARWIEEGSIEKEGMKVINEAKEMESPRTKARRELYGLDSKGKSKEKVVDQKEFEEKAQESAAKLEKGKKVEEEDIDMEEEEEEEDEDEEQVAHTKSAAIPTQPVRRKTSQQAPAPSPTSPLGQALSSTSDSLSSTLRNLSSSLERYASHPPAQRRNGEDSGKWFVDLKLHTEAIKDVLGVIGQVERARRTGN
ncbi:uncharacterized protein IL334_005214 [Kwoniella shivajii]|uniref:GATA-type domain-containing protein n=1 Tax=Kwoniella shivajii TaxID=564305 RepID=A0ABZ1D2Q8_9TREE|nr:hypothetical protein IL334_005214 [Kwoniella shivajii]